MNNLNLPCRIPLQIIVDVYREEGLALKWVSRPRHSPSAALRTTVIKFPKHKGQSNMACASPVEVAERMKTHQESLS